VRDQSKNRAKAVAKAGRLHSKVKAQRHTERHQFTAMLARSHPVVVLETLATTNMMA